jgi:hypothetical protein
MAGSTMVTAKAERQGGLDASFCPVLRQAACAQQALMGLSAEERWQIIEHLKIY